MRIDDIESSDFKMPYTNIEKDMEDIELLINDIQNTENSLRRRKRGNKYKHNDHTSKENSFKYITGSDINDIDDVVIEIDVPEEYYTNKERRIIPYTNYTSIYIINTIIYLINLVLNFIINFIIKRKKIKSL